MAQRNVPRWLIVVGALVLVVALFVAFFRWDWLIPLVEARASAALGRKVTIAHLHVQLGRVTRIVADDVVVANPDGFPADSRLAHVDELGIDVNVAGYLSNRSALEIPRIDVRHPTVDVTTNAEGQPNWNVGSGASGSGGPAVKIGDLVIEDGHAQVKIPKLKTDFALDIATREASGPDKAAEIVVDAKGTYAAQPITGRFVGGALLSLRDKEHPYPIDLRAANGPTKVTITGTVEDPLSFRGANVKLGLAGPDMALLYHLTGVPIPETPPYDVSGHLDYQAGKVKFTDFAGRLGHSDIEGSIAVDTGGEKPKVTADLSSRLVDLTDLGGFIGATPGRAGQGQTAKQQQEKNREARSGNLLPDEPLNLPKLQAADVDLRYRGHRIEGRSMPLDNLSVDATVQNGAVRVHPISFGVGKGQIAGTIDLDPAKGGLALKADIDFRQVDVARLMAATHAFGGAGTIGGRAIVSGTGNSIAQIMAHGNGDLKLFMSGGDLSALLVNLAGLDFGNSLLSALGIPARTPVRCMIVHLPLDQGILSTKTMLIDTTEANILGSGTINLRNETIDYQVKTDPKHFSVGSLPAPIDITGPLKSPSVLPDPKALAVRGGAAVALGLLLTPLAALLPTIQLGLGEDTDCGRELATAGAQGSNRLTPAQVQQRTHGAASSRRPRR